MSREFTLKLVLGSVFITWTTWVGAYGEPSTEARGMPGALGTFEFRPADWKEGATTWWKDSDGVDPGTPGCHVGTDEKGELNGRMYGEACLPDGRLVESGPGFEELHNHENDLGHFDMFDCQAWCTGEGFTRGACVVKASLPCERSALCKCEL